MDEPTSSLTITESNKLLAVIDDLKADGIAVIFISHRLGEVEQCADRVVVLRDGKLAGELSRHEIKHDAMISLMIGRTLSELYNPPAGPRGPVMLRLQDLRTRANPDTPVTLDIHAGEILGLAGLIGAGRTELALAVFGIDLALGGSVEIDGQPFDARTPRKAIDRGLFLVPEDRKQSGLILEFPVEQNISLASLAAIARFGLVDHQAERMRANDQRQKLSIKTPDVRNIAADLSGGNQQKIVLAKWLIR
ncbi:MAG: sugar ABC transporter ATP-binding protein, partial [Rhodospirillales bacterium]|nr:sugar ABC transporter ATP-binding protein [Rhodospirillales bacterium]